MNLSVMLFTICFCSIFVFAIPVSVSQEYASGVSLSSHKFLQKNLLLVYICSNFQLQILQYLELLYCL